MPARPVPDRTLRHTVKVRLQSPNHSAACKVLKLDDSTLRHRLALALKRFGPECGITREMIGEAKLRNVGLDHLVEPSKPREFTVTATPDGDMDVDELLEHRIKAFEKRKRAEEARKLIPVKVHVPGPIGILHFGDPHVDDDGTDILALKRHKELCAKTEGLFAANVGDVTNNWVGRLAKLYAEQATTASQAWQLAEWLIKGTPWLYLIGGNHDGWSGAGDPLKWIARQADSIYQSSECRLELQLPSGHRPRINARHDFAGHSQYNPAHGPMKALLFGIRDHIAICGHRHKSGHGVLKDPASGIICHTIQVSSYKIYDRYAREKGFRDQSLSPCVMTVIDTRLAEDHPDFITLWWDPEHGADYLRFIRKQAKAA